MERIKLQPWMLPTLIIAGAALLRFLFIFHWHPPQAFIFSDMKEYHDRGVDFLVGTRDPHLFFQPIGMSLLFALSTFLHSYIPLDWYQFVLSVGTVILIWRTTEFLAGRSIGILSLLLASFHYPFLLYSGVYLAECSFTFLMAFFIFLLAKKPYPWNGPTAALLAFVFFLAFLFKGNFIMFVPLLFVWAYLKGVKLNSALIFVSVFGFFLVLHGIFAYRTTGQFQLSASSGGLNLVEGKCPDKFNEDPTGGWYSPLFLLLGESQKKVWKEPFTNSKFYVQQGLQCIAQNPMVLVESLRYIPYLFISNDMWPSLFTLPQYLKTTRGYSLFYAFFVLPSLIFGLMLLFKIPWDQKFLTWVVPILSLLLLVWIFKSELRFRAPFDVVIIPASIWGWFQILSHVYPQWNETRRFRTLLGVLLFAAVITVHSLIL